MMEAIEKAKVQEFADKVAAQADQNTKAIAEMQAQTLRMQGAKAALDYILAIDPVVVAEKDYVDWDYDIDVTAEYGDGDDITSEDVQEVINYLEDPANYDDVYGGVDDAVNKAA